MCYIVCGLGGGVCVCVCVCVFLAGYAHVHYRNIQSVPVPAYIYRITFVTFAVVQQHVMDMQHPIAPFSWHLGVQDFISPPLVES